MLLSQVNYAQSKDGHRQVRFYKTMDMNIFGIDCVPSTMGLEKMKKTSKSWIQIYIEYFFPTSTGKNEILQIFWLQIFYVCTHTHFRRDSIPWACWYFTWSPRSYEGHPKILLQHFQHWLLFTDRSWDLSCWTCQTLTQMNWYAQKAASLLLHDLASSWS